jgi:hypothetical protein
MFSMKLWLRAFLGLDDIPSLAMFKAMELSQQTRHNALMTALDRIEKRMINTHVGEPRNLTIPVLDWDTVQAIALHEMEKNPPKEN